MAKFELGDIVKKVAGAASPYEGIVLKNDTPGHICGKITRGNHDGFSYVGDYFGDEDQYYELVTPSTWTELEKLLWDQEPP